MRKDWDKKLDSILWAFGTSYKMTTHMTHSRMTYRLKAVNSTYRFMMPNLTIAVEEKMPMKESRRERIQKLLMIKKGQQAGGRDNCTRKPRRYEVPH